MGAIITMGLAISLIVTILEILNGFLNTDKELVKMAETFNASKFQILTKIVIPANVGTFFNSLKVNIGLSLVGVISFKTLFLSSAALGVIALLLSMNIKYKKVAQSPHRTKVARFDVLEKSAINPAIILFFITLTFGGIASFLPLHAVEKGVAGIEMYFIFYAVTSRGDQQAYSLFILFLIF